MNLSKESKELAIFSSVIIAIISVFSFMLFGTAGLRVALGVIFVSLPFYLVLNRLDLTNGEKFVFSILMGITLLPSFAYLLGFLVSFRTAILIVFVLLMGIALLLGRFRKN